MTGSDTQSFRNGDVSDWGEMSLVTRQRGTQAAVALAKFSIQLDFFALTLALPDMARSFAVTAQSAQWTLSGYMLSLGSLFIVAGRIGDIVGRKRAFGTGCLLFTATMIGAALAPSLPVLVLFRVLQGAGAGLMFPVGIALVLPTFVTSWWAYVPVFASCGFGLGLGWTFTNIATQEVVGPDRAGEASGVVLTFLVTTGGVGLAGAASIIGGLLRAGHDRASAYNTTLLAFALLALAAAAAVLATRHMLVRRGLMKPLSMAADQAGEAAEAARAGRRPRVG